MVDGDEIELGSSGIVSAGGGWLRELKTGNLMDPKGKVYNKDGDLIFDPEDNEGLSE